MGQGGWGSSPRQSFGTTRVMVAGAGVVVGHPRKAWEGEVWLPARCFSVDQRLLGGPKLPHMAKATRIMGVARDLSVVPGSLGAQQECWRQEARQR